MESMLNHWMAEGCARAFVIVIEMRNVLCIIQTVRRLQVDKSRVRSRRKGVLRYSDRYILRRSRFLLCENETNI